MKSHYHIERWTSSSLREQAQMGQRFQGFDEKPCPNKDRNR
jgi:hypothetical protein